MATDTLFTEMADSMLSGKGSKGLVDQRSVDIRVARKWTRLSRHARHLPSDGSGVSVFKGGKFSWADVVLNRKPPKKSDDLCKMLLSEYDTVAQMNPAQCFMSKFSLAEAQELLVCSSSHWLLSGMELKYQTVPVSGLVQELQLPWNAEKITLLIPCTLIHVPEQIQAVQKCLTVKEVHQIVRELVVGMFVFNQIPQLTFEETYEHATMCHLMPAYQDTLIGQAMLEVDYMAKCLWHGSYFSSDARQKFAQCWRSRLNVNLHGEAETKRPLVQDFLHAGIQDVTTVLGYERFYELIKEDWLDFTKIGENLSLNTDFFSIGLDFFIDTVCQEQTTLLLKSQFAVVGAVKSIHEEAHCDATKDYLRRITEGIQKHLCSCPDVQFNVEKLRIVATLLPLFVGLKRLQKIPNLAYLASPIPRKETKTQRELPPHLVSKEFKHHCFHKETEYFGLRGGIQFDIETPWIKQFALSTLNELPEDLVSSNTDSDESDTASSKENTPMPTLIVNGERYYALELKLENFVARNCQKPLWANQLYLEMCRLRFKSLPLTTTQLNEQFRKVRGPNSPSAFDNVDDSLHLAAERGMVAAFHALLREVQTNQYESQNRQGWSLVHTASCFNNIHIVGLLIQLGINVNSRQFMYNSRTEFGEPLPDISCKGANPLHLAARCGALQAMSCLLACSSDVWARDEDGWAPIHHAAFNNQLTVARLILSKFNQVEMITNNNLSRTSLLLCSVSGSLETIKWLLQNGCRVDVLDAKLHNAIHLATLHFKIHLLQYFITCHRADLPVWNTLSQMLNDYRTDWQVAAIKCIGVLSLVSEYVENVIQAGLPKQLVSLMQKYVNQQHEIVTTLSVMSYHPEVFKALVETKPMRILIQLLSSSNEATCSKTASVIGDVAASEIAKTMVGERGGIEALSLLLKSNNVELLLNSLKALSSICRDHPENKNRLANGSIITSLVSLLKCEIDDVCEAASHSLSTVATCHATNQTVIIEAGVLSALRHLLLDRKPALQKMAVCVIKVLAHDNPVNQAKMLDVDVFQPTVNLLKGMDLELKEVAAQALWAMAGSETAPRKFVAHKIGNIQLINMLMTKSELLVCTCCPFVSAVTYEDVDEQKRFLNGGGTGPLLRLLQPDSSEAVLCTVMQTLNILCLGMDYLGNKCVQSHLFNQGIFETVTPLLSVENAKVQVESLNTIACLVLNHKENQKMVTQNVVNLRLFNELLKHTDKDVRLSAGKALAFIAYNKDFIWDCLKRKIQVEISFFNEFLTSQNTVQQCFAAYEIALLGPVVPDRDNATCIVLGIELLVSKLESSEEDVFVLAASLVCSLARGHAGISDALVVLGLVERMFDKLVSPGGTAMSCQKCASTLACLSFNQTARRKMMSLCRRKPSLYKLLLANMPTKGRISRKLAEEFESICN